MIEISLKVIFNDVDLAQWITVTKGFTRGIRGEKDITTTNVGNSNGSILLSERYLEKTISMPFVVLKLTLKKQRELSAVLNVDEPKRLIFGDEPDKYYMAMPAQSVDFEELRTYGRGTIDWLCLDPFAYGKDEKTFTNVGNTITIKNSGTYPTPVSFDIQNQSDNGFVGLVSKDGQIQFGNPDEIDGYAYTQSETRLYNSFENSSELSQFSFNTHQPSYYKPKSLVGSFETKKGTNQDYSLQVKDYAAGPDRNNWYGPSAYKAFSPNSKGEKTADNFILRSLLQAKANENEFGVHELTVLDDKDKPLCGFYFRKLNWATRDIQLYMFVRDTIVQKWEGPSAWIMKDFLGTVNIEKNGADFSFRVDNRTNNIGGLYHYHDEEAGKAKAKGIVYWVGQAGGRLPTFNKQLFWVDVRENIGKWEDSRNMFTQNDKIRVDCSDKTVKPYLNGALVLGIMDLGSVPIIAQPGTTDIIMAGSQFAQPLKGTARIRERWL